MTKTMTKTEKTFLEIAKTMPREFSVRDKAFSEAFGGGLIGMTYAIEAYQGLAAKGVIVITDRDFSGDATKAVISNRHKNS